ncbi:endoplasmic oxidoreductin-1 [Stygiomarasmius scandens]|uniref:Endoplasmic oxidoreductin-1 n=1 Tax=Marasmiellus scandens TaxID=2682957 RepID=A0ABR1JP91_9AGAR
MHSSHLFQTILRITPLLLSILQARASLQNSLVSNHLHSGVDFGSAPAQIVFGEQSGQGRIDISECQNVKPTGPIDTTLCDYETVDEINDELYESLRKIVKEPFFKYLQLDLYRGCPFWQEDETCTSSTCSIETVDESQIPEEWRTKALSKVEPLPDYHQLAKGCYYKDTDFCISEDPTSLTGEYYDLSVIPERYTGYSGAGARRIWQTIYEDNCFASESDGASSLEKSQEEQCLEAKVYRRIISGLHASISTHICLDYLNQTTGEWAPNLQCYVERVAFHPERLENIYFNVVLLLRAIARLAPHLAVYDYQMSTLDPKILDRVFSLAHKAGRFDENVMFNGKDADALKEEFKYHFRNVTRVMDCIDCDKCRLWGKVQTTGVATALKILFELDENALSLSPGSTLLQRSEIVALFNTLHRFSESLRAVEQFRRLWTSEVGALEQIDIPEGTVPEYNSFSVFMNRTCEKVGSMYQLCKEGTIGSRPIASTSDSEL